MTLIPSYVLNDGVSFPAIGFGTYPLRGKEGVAALVSAIEAGYRLLDTAVMYENEAEVGEAVRHCGLERDELLVTSKIPGSHHGYDEAIRCVEESLQRLGLEQIDLMLIHWPNPAKGLYGEAWRALVECRERGLVRSIGVSNFTEAHLTRIIDESGVTPAVNQIELHPSFPQAEMRAVNAKLGIRTESWSPLGERGAYDDLPVVQQAADAYGVSPAQVILRWQVELGAVPIPKSGDPVRQRANLDIFNFSLAADEVAALSSLGRPDGRLFGADPDTLEES